MAKKSISLHDIICGNVGNLMSRYNLNQKEFAEKVGIKPSTLSERMNGNACWKDAELSAICDKFKVTPVVLVRDNLQEEIK